MTHDHLDSPGLPVLMRGARRAYGSAVREALSEIGCDDVPRNGAFVIGRIAAAGAPLAVIIEGLGVSKQAAGQLVDTLVERGYLDRAVDPDDRRRLTVALTDRGRVAAVAIGSAVEAVDERLVASVGADYVAHTRETLQALIDQEEA